MTHTAVLFDLDGTLLDTIADLGGSMNAVLTRLGYPTHELAAYKYFVGDGMVNLVRRTLPEGVKNDEEIVRRTVPLILAEYDKRWKDETRPYEGIPELLEELDARHVKKAILSNKPHSALQDVVGHFFKGRRFDAVMGQRPGVPLKPDPGAVREICGMLGKEPADFLYLGDTNTDMLTARGSGMYAVGVLWGFRKDDELRAAGAQVLIRHPSEVLGLL